MSDQDGAYKEGIMSYIDYLVNLVWIFFLNRRIKMDLILIKKNKDFMKIALSFVHIARHLRGNTWSKS